jgi:hypothetical protein
MSIELMQSTRLPVPTRQTDGLPALPRDAEIIGNRILRVFDRLGFQHTNQDGTTFGVRFSSATLICGELASYTIDAEALWHFTARDLVTDKVIDHLANVLEKTVYVTRRPLTLFVELKPQPKPVVTRLPHRIDLDLDKRPEGEYLVGFGLGHEGLLWHELAKLTHIIVAGSSDSGKSAFLRSLVYQLARQPLPIELYLADLEGLTFAWAESWSILKAPIAQDVAAATAITDKLLAEIDRRARLYFATGKFPESLAEYHRYADDRLPWLVAIFDEFSSLVEEAGKASALVKNISQLAMRARKFGMTLVFAGQDFKADLLNTRITNQLKTRVQFRCARREQSEVVLGKGGAEAITVPGRALVRLAERNDVIECQTFWVDKSKVVDLTADGPAIGLALPQHLVDLVRWAVEQNGGYLSLGDLQERGGLGQGEARRLAGQWERKGWLAKDRNKGNRRFVTESLGRVLELVGYKPTNPTNSTNR